jgi:hypothetical protein
MPFLQVGAGGGAVAVPVNSFSEDDPFRVGGQQRAADGTLLSDTSIIKRRFSVVSLMTSANLALLEALMGLDAEQPVTGDSLRNGGATITCQIRMSVRKYEHDVGVTEGFQIEATMKFEQV